MPGTGSGRPYVKKGGTGIVDGITWSNITMLSDYAASNPELVKLINSTLGNIAGSLMSDTRCRNWLLSGWSQGQGAMPATYGTQRLVDTVSRLGNEIAVGSTGSATAAQAPALGGVRVDGETATILINTGSFVNPLSSMGMNTATQNSVILGINSGSQQAVGLLLLHELGHLFSIPGFNQHDGSTALNGANNDIVMANCGTTVGRLGN